MENKRLEAKLKSVRTAYNRMMDEKRSFTWRIHVLNPLASEHYQLFDKGTVSKKVGGEFTDQRDFNTYLELAMADDDIAKLLIEFTLVKTKGKTDEASNFSCEIELREVYGTAPIQPQAAEPEEPQAKYVPTSADYSGLLGAINMLGLVPEGGLAGFDPADPSQQIAMVLKVRDDMNTRRWEERERQKSLDGLQIERDSLNTRVNELEEQVNKLIEKCENLEDKLCEKKEQLKATEERLASLHPNASLAGVALTQLGASVAQTLLQRNIGTIGKLIGLNGLGEAFAAAQQAEAAAQQPQPQQQPQAAADDEEPVAVEVEEQ